MPKMKSRSGARKRFHVTSTGKIKRGSAYRSHILTSKTRKRKRKLRKGGTVAPGDMRSVRSMLQM